MADDLVSLAAAFVADISERKSDFEIIPVDPQSGELLTGQGRVFQYFPETIADSKAVSWQPKEIPGASLPIYQWTGSGERSITFQAWFTSDLDPQGGGQAGLIATATPGKNRRAIDVKSALMWLRSFMFPTYLGSSPTTTGRQLTLPPRKALLRIPGLGLGYLGGDVAGSDKDEVLTVMTQCEISIEEMFPSGAIRNATVQLAFAQVAQNGTGTVAFPSYTPSYGNLVFGSNSPVDIASGSVPGAPQSGGGYTLVASDRSGK